MQTSTTPSASQSVVPLNASEINSQVDILIALHLHLWQALTIAIQNSWGTSNPQLGEDKRDWLAGAVSDLFAQNQLRDLEDLEDVLEQVMSDEFEVVVDDGTLEEVSQKIWKGVERVRAGDGSEVKELMAVWQEKKKTGEKIVGIVNGGASADNDSSSDDDYDDNDDDNTGVTELNKGHHPQQSNADLNDVDMEEGPALIDVVKRPEPEVDEDGFTKVVSKKKR